MNRTGHSSELSSSTQRFSLVIKMAAALFTAMALTSATARGQIFESENGYATGSVGEFDLSGNPLSPSLIGGLGGGWGLAVSGSDLFVAQGNGTIGEYTTSGATINPSLVTGLSNPRGIAASGSQLFVANQGSGTVGEYTISGGAVVNSNPTFISGMYWPTGITVSGSDLFVTDFLANQIREYTTSGTLENNYSNPTFNDPTFIAVSEPDMYVTNFNLGTVSEYNTTTGATINSSLISGLDFPESIALVGSDLYVANESSGTIGEYDINGNTINAALISGLMNGMAGPNGLAVVSVPEPTSASLMLLAGAAILRRRQKRA